MTEILRRQNSENIYHKVPPALLLGVSAAYGQRALVAESGKVRIQMVKHNKVVGLMVAVHETPCAIPPHNSNSRLMII
jgi:hypothetical protein